MQKNNFFKFYPPILLKLYDLLYKEVPIIDYFIKQIGDKDCSLTCLKMLMAMTYKNKAYLYYPEATSIESVNLFRITQIAKKEGITLSGYRMKSKPEILKEELNLPLIITFNEDKMLHAVLLKKITPEKVLIYDPMRGVYWLNSNEFLERWTGFLLEITQAKEPEVKFYARRLEFIPRRLIGFTLVFQILSLISLLLAMLFIDKNFNFLIPVLLFGAYIIFEFIYQLLILKSLKSFDKKILIDDYVFKRNKFKDFYEPMEKFKFILISTPMKLMSSIVVIVFGVFILGINSLYNLLVLGILFAVQFTFKILDKKYLDCERSDLENLEKNLIVNTNEDEEKFKENVTNLNKKSYKLVSYINLKKYILLFLNLILCLVYQAITGFVSLNFMLFHIFLYSYLEENFEKILDTSDLVTQYRYYKCLYLYYFN